MSMDDYLSNPEDALEPIVGKIVQAFGVGYRNDEERRWALMYKDDQLSITYIKAVYFLQLENSEPIPRATLTYEVSYKGEPVHDPARSVMQHKFEEWMPLIDRLYTEAISAEGVS